jgi:hypothetical protein
VVHSPQPPDPPPGRLRGQPATSVLSLHWRSGCPGCHDRHRTGSCRSTMPGIQSICRRFLIFAIPRREFGCPTPQSAFHLLCPDSRVTRLRPMSPPSSSCSSVRACCSSPRGRCPLRWSSATCRPPVHAQSLHREGPAARQLDGIAGIYPYVLLARKLLALPSAERARKRTKEPTTFLSR